MDKLLAQVSPPNGADQPTCSLAQPKKCEDSANDDNQPDDVDNGIQNNLLLR